MVIRVWKSVKSVSDLNSKAVSDSLFINITLINKKMSTFEQHTSGLVSKFVVLVINAVFKL